MAEEEQYQKPVGEEGKAVIAKMYEHHRELTIWGLANIPAKTAMNVLDVGCGGGMAVKMLALKYPNAKITGIDISEECIQATLDYNKVFHQWGKVDAKVASVENVPFEDSSLDIITIPDSVEKIGETAFDGTNKMFIIQCSFGTYAEQYARSHRLKYQLI